MRGLIYKYLNLGLANLEIRAAQLLKGLPPEILDRKPATGGWKILECVEHLNRYGPRSFQTDGPDPGQNIDIDIKMDKNAPWGYTQGGHLPQLASHRTSGKEPHVRFVD